MIGTAKSDATVTVNNQPTSRAGEYFHGVTTFDNSTAPVFGEVQVVGVKNHVGPNDEDAVTEESGHVFLPKTPEVFTYDDDGNLLSDGRWNYTWDGENRLIGMETRPDVAQPPSAVVRQKLEFSYDHQGRRVSKKVFEWNSGSSSYQLQATRYFIYNEWNLLAELDGAWNLVRSYTWGLDLSGTLQGAGGVGGLLFSTEYSVPRIQCFSYDGNGNVIALIDTEDGKITGEYEYSPFGETLREEGDAAEENPFRFSSKYSDVETGLAYYGYRYLNPGMGRWASRDPIGENKDINLFSFALNNPIQHTDVLGLLTDLGAFLQLVNHWALPNDQEPFIRTGGEWGEYMMSKKSIKSFAAQQYFNIARKHIDSSPLSGRYFAKDGLHLDPNSQLVIQTLNQVDYLIDGNYEVERNHCTITLKNNRHQVLDSADFHPLQVALFPDLYLAGLSVVGLTNFESPVMRRIDPFGTILPPKNSRFQPFAVQITWYSDNITYEKTTDGRLVPQYPVPWPANLPF